MNTQASVCRCAIAPVCAQCVLSACSSGRGNGVHLTQSGYVIPRLGLPNTPELSDINSITVADEKPGMRESVGEMMGTNGRLTARDSSSAPLRSTASRREDGRRKMEEGGEAAVMLQR